MSHERREGAAGVTRARSGGIMRMTMRARPPPFLLALAVLVAAPSLAADEPAPRAGAAAPAAPADPAPGAVPVAGHGDRAAEYQAFRSDFDAGRYTEALPHAERVVALTEAADDAHHAELPSALNNLGATQYRLGDFVAAEKSYARAVALAEEARGALSPRLIAPLRGLALTYQGMGRHEVAVPLLERAVAISRRSLGLFDAGQRDLLLPLADSYVALGRWRDADRAQHYALSIGEHEYGANDARLVPALLQLGRWYLASAQRAAARETYERARALAANRARPDPIGQIIALRGIAEAYRLDYQFGPEFVVDPNHAGEARRLDPLEIENARRNSSMFGPDYVLAAAGEEALTQALSIAEHLNPPAPTAVGVVLVDLGDWQMVAGHNDRALPFYRRALPRLPAESGAAETGPSPLSHPALLLYREAPASMHHRDLPPSAVIERYAVAEFTVTADGRVKDAKIAEGDATDTQRSAYLSALSHAVFRPRFVDGKPVATDSVRQRETFRVLKPATP